MIYLNISLISLKLSKSFLSGSILRNSQTGFCSITFCISFHSQYFCHYDHFQQFLLQVYSHENINQFNNLKYHIMFECFSFEWSHYFCLHCFFCYNDIILFKSYFFSKLICWCCSTILITLIANFLPIKIMFGWFFNLSASSSLYFI